MQTSRLRFLAYPRFQLVLIVLNFAVLVGFFVTAFVAVEHSYSYLRSEGLALGLPEGHSYYKFLSMQSQVVFRALIVALIVSILLSGAFTLFWSHRLAGPLDRIRRYFDRLAEGHERRPLVIRKKDLLPELAQSINRALDRISRR